MATLSISYEPTRQSAVLSYPERDATWESIRRICEDFSDEVLVEGSRLSIPWWSFVAARRDIGYRLRSANGRIEADAAAESLLNQSRKRELAVNALASTPHLSASEVRAKIDGKMLFGRELKSYQADNIALLSRLDVGATFSVPGAGKTTEAFAFFALRANEDDHLLVVAPKNAFAAWEEQIKFWTFKDEFVRLTGGRAAIAHALMRSPRFMLITYQQLTRVRSSVSAFLAKNPTFVFLDESHKIKGGVDKITARAALSLSYLSAGRLIMSGTPMPNSVADLVPQFKFLIPESALTPENVIELAKPLYVRTTKAQLDLPPVQRYLHEIAMRPAQERVYRLMKSEIARVAETKLRGTERQRLRRLGGNATSLLQFVSNPALLIKRGSEFVDLLGDVLEEGDSPKLEYACNRARALAADGLKVIIWSSFVENVEIISQRLQDLGADYIHGGVETGSEEEDDTRERKIKRFHDDPRSMVLVANPAACSEGISLHTICNHAIYVDRNYNVAQYLQSEDRIHRIGSTKTCIIDILTSPGTIDLSVKDRLGLKVVRMGEALDDPGLNIDPILYDIESDGFDAGDMQSFIEHLKDAS
jgi:SNF2 family DNA or RNA helicase